MLVNTLPIGLASHLHAPAIDEEVQILLVRKYFQAVSRFLLALLELVPS